jgi:uncharacterized membrane protein
MGMSSTEVLLLAFLIGVIAGLRALTPLAVIACAGFWHGFLRGTPLSFMGRLPAVIIFSVLALLELVNDKRPSTPSRLKPPGIIARIFTGALSGACVAAARAGSIALGISLGIVGGVVGAFAGFYARGGLVRALKVSDLPIALLEDAIAIGGAIVIVACF